MILDSQFGSPISGWSITICHEAGQVELSALNPGTAITDLSSPPDFEAITPFANGFTVDCVIDTSFVTTLPVDAYHQLYTIDYEWVPSGFQWSELDFCTSPSGPNGTLINSGGNSYAPFTFDTFIFNGVVDPIAFYQIPLSSGTYDAGSGAGEITIEPRVFPGLIPTFELEGLSMAVSHDSILLQVDSVEPAGEFAQLFGGSGPEIVLVEIFDDGWVIDMTVDTTGSNIVLLNDLVTPVHATYSTIPAAITPGSCVASWLRFDNSIGVGNELDFVGFGSEVPLFEDNVLVLTPVAVSFLRGDVNDDSTLNLADGITQLGALFSGTGPLDCTDAADTNDDGNFNIADTIYLLSFLFTAGAPPPAPFPDCGLDPTPDSLGCSSSACP
ncbi:MAG: hypothetical protein CBC13_04135 [Planctomycetia bacterium TMED53]|nr:MAG: hypothetical protein CBC13_04135 [Planctomycetia bacterium TMED53]